MKRSIIRTGTALITAALLLCADFSLAAENPPGTSAEAKTTKKAAAKKPKAKLVDINSASKAELKKLPGIGDAEADKIIAGRPYLTKAHLLTHNVLPDSLYEPIKGRIVAKQKSQK